MNRFVDAAFVLFLLACALASVAALSFHGKRLEHEALESHRRLLAVDSHHHIEHLTQLFETVDITLHTLLESRHRLPGVQDWNELLHAALRNAPHLRSLSLVDAFG